MIIACPKCETSFSLPDEQYRPGKKARCSQCKNVFPMAEVQPDLPDEPLPEPASLKSGSKKSGKILRLAIGGLSALLILLLVYGGYRILSSMSSPAGKSEQANQAQAEKESLISGIALDDIRQFLVDNSEVGKLMVIQGFADNNSSGSRDYIAVEARVLDAHNQVLARTEQFCGVHITLFQLQNLPEQALKDALSNMTTIMINNTNIAPKTKVPFVVVFFNPPENMRTFEVQVVSARESPPVEKK